MSRVSSRPRRPIVLILSVLAGLPIALQAGGCYYMQAVGGQLEVMRKREPIETVIQDPALPEATRDRLGIVLEARRFAVDSLLLPDNDSYRSYADLEREYVVWNVFAAPEFSLQPKTWCFPVVGCVAYRGYFSQAAAEKHADRLARDGLDVHVGGVPAYSTLGRFDDPVLNTMMRWSDTDLVSTVFHELAHQKLFVKGDTAFNESFATAVAEIGLSRWLESRSEQGDVAGNRQREALRAALTAEVESTRGELRALYADAALSVEDKRRAKRQLLDALSARARSRASELGFSGAGWLEPPLNNARLASSALYRSRVPAFRRLLADCDEALDCFYAEAARLSEFEPEARSRALDRLDARRGTTAGDSAPGAAPP